MGGSGVDAGAVSERRMSVDPPVRSTERRNGKAGWNWGDRRGTPAQRLVIFGKNGLD